MSGDLDYSLRNGDKVIVPSPSTSTANHQNGTSSKFEHQSLHRSYHGPCTSGLDTPLSAMQSAAAKTALVIKKTPIIQNTVVRIEEDVEDDQYSRHWIFRRRVGFDDASASGELGAAVAASTVSNGIISSESCDAAKLQEEKALLKQQLESIQCKRRQLVQTHTHLSTFKSEWTFQLSSAQYSHDLAFSSWQSCKRKSEHVQNQYTIAQRWHVLGDAFFIWHNGPFATINGTRLGRCAKTAFSTEGESNNNKASFFSWGDNAQRQTIPTSVTVPFHEINSALGQVVFLLYTLQHTPNSGITFRRHVLQPCGHASKIGFLKNAKLPTQTTRQQQLQHTHYGERRRIFATHDDVTWYSLHHYDENGSYLSMGYYARRNFNAALEGLIYCIAEACLVVERRDMALSVPYNINVSGLNVGKEKEKGDGTTTVGRLPVIYDPDEGERWTTVWRYLLTDLKWLVAYIAKHVDR